MVPPKTIFLLSIMFTFVLFSGMCSSPGVNANDTYQQQKTNAILERIVKAQEDQATALKEIAQQLRRK